MRNDDQNELATTFEQKDISIIIVSYNTSDILCDCLDSILAHIKDISYEVIVVDNASIDNSCSVMKNQYKWIKLIELQQNIGFGRANNLAFQIAKGEMLFLLNSDTKLIDNSVKILYDFLKNNQDTGVCGGLLLDSKLSPAFSYGYKLSLKRELLSFFGLERKPFPLSEEIRDVDYIQGADMMIKREVIDKTKGFDPDFFFSYEETEWSYRIWQEGYKIKFVPQARIIHLQGMSGVGKQVLNLKIKEEQWFSRFLYFKKVYNKNHSIYLYNLHLIRYFVAYIIYSILGNKNKQSYWKTKHNLICKGYQKYKKHIKCE